MGCLGVLFAVTDADVKALISARLTANRDESVMEVIETIEERWDEDWMQQTDKAWDAIHRCLSDGQLNYESGEYPLNHCILGGTPLYDGDDYIVFLKSPKQVADVAAAFKNLDEATFRERYFKIDAETYDGEVSEQDWEYTWGWFEGMSEFYEKAAKAQRMVLFTVDQ